MTYIEEYLEHLCSNYLSSLQSSDAIYFSIYKQTARGIGLTDRQYSLVLKKIKEYMHVENLPTQIPLREIDRSKYVRVCKDDDEIPLKGIDENRKWFKVRFPFSKKDIVKIDNINLKISSKNYYHKKGTHEHYYKLNGYNLDVVLTYFSHFDLCDNVKEYKKIIDNIKQQEKEIISSLPIPKNDYLTDVQQYDRQRRLGIVDITKPFTNNSLLDSIIDRNDSYYNVSPSKYNLNNIIEVIQELDRFPLLVLIEESNAYEELTNFYNSVKYIVPDEKQSVLFRLSNNGEERQFNNFIKNNQLNNWVDNNTKVVYINKTKLPKILLNSSFRPITCYSKNNSKNQQFVDIYINHYCDLILSLDDMNWASSYHRYYVKGF